MSKEFSELIRNEVLLFKDHLAEIYGIVITEKKEIDWGIKYSIELKSVDEQGIVVIYCNKKGNFSHRFEKKINIENQRIFADVFEKRNNLQDKLEDENANNYDEKSIKLKSYYESLLPYKNEEFDFICFARELANDLPEDKLCDIRYDFSKLEKIYQNQIRGKGCYGI